MNDVRITILMPVYNGEKYIKEAIDSILNQTYKNFEFLIINDGSTDDSAEIVKSYKDSRIRLLVNEHNLGLTSTLNIGLREAKGEYIARMDVDDISLPDRLKQQAAFLDAHPDVGIVGTSFIRINKDSTFFDVPVVLRYDDDLQMQLLYENPFVHGSIMFKKSLLIKLREPYYRSGFEGAEDYDLWSRLAEITKVRNMSEILYKYRINPGGITATRKKIQQEKTKFISKNNYKDAKPSDFNIVQISKLQSYKNYRITIDNKNKIIFGRNKFIRHQFALMKICFKKRYIYRALLLCFSWLLAIFSFMILQPIYFFGSAVRTIKRCFLNDLASLHE